MRRTVPVSGICLMASAAPAQPPGGDGQWPPITPAQQAAAAKRQAEMTAPRPIEILGGPARFHHIAEYTQ